MVSLFVDITFLGFIVFFVFLILFRKRVQKVFRVGGYCFLNLLIFWLHKHGYIFFGGGINFSRISNFLSFSWFRFFILLLVNFFVKDTKSFVLLIFLVILDLLVPWFPWFLIFMLFSSLVSWLSGFGLGFWFHGSLVLSFP